VSPGVAVWGTTNRPTENSGRWPSGITTSVIMTSWPPSTTTSTGTVPFGNDTGFAKKSAGRVRSAAFATSCPAIRTSPPAGRPRAAFSGAVRHPDERVRRGRHVEGVVVGDGGPFALERHGPVERIGQRRGRGQQQGGEREPDESHRTPPRGPGLTRAGAVG